MSIRIKFMFSYTVMIVVFILILAAVIWLITVLMPAGDKLGKHGAISFTSTQLQLYGELTAALSGRPELPFAQPERERLTGLLRGADAELAVTENGEWVWLTPPMEASGLFSPEAPPEDGGTWRMGDRNYRLIRTDFTDAQGSPATAWLMLPGVNVRHFVIIFIVLGFLFAIALTNFFLTYFTSRSVIRPLNELKAAADRIRQGRLDFRIRPASKDEVGMLAAAFEEMRSRLKESIEQSLQYEENRKELITHISHDLRTPIASIKGYVEGLMDGVANTPEKHEKYIRTIYAKARDLDRMIDELFLLSKLDLGRQPYHMETVDLAAFLNDCMEEMRFDLDKRGIGLRWSRPETPLYVNADREKLKRVVANIVENSAKHLSGTADGRIECGISDGGEEAVVFIRDNGPGIREEDLPLIFDRFYRGGRLREADAGGSGLGLAIVKKIVEGHGGKAWAESIRGEGAALLFSLPKVPCGTEVSGGDEHRADH